MIKLIDVTKEFKNEMLYRDVNLEINDGDRVLLIGDNGSGKSVLMKLIVGFSQPTQGQVLVDGKKLGDKNDFIQNAGVSINQADFLNHLTGLENLLLLANYKKVSTKEDIMDLAKKLYFDQDILKKYKVFSLGMRQKMRFMQALLDKPKYLILDEPFDALDSKSKESMLEILRDYLDKDRTLIFTAHNSDVHDLATKVFLINSDTKNIERVK